MTHDGISSFSALAMRVPAFSRLTGLVRRARATKECEKKRNFTGSASSTPPLLIAKVLAMASSVAWRNGTGE